MKLESKFSIGDKVWVIGGDYRSGHYSGSLGTLNGVRIVPVPFLGTVGTVSMDRDDWIVLLFGILCLAFLLSIPIYACLETGKCF